ncbi:MAG: YdcF family protein [Streptococcaceae bacterium]|jgi:uncharacterized SAM-binding protein YcdF (DUF218 family)|nr:YdcF family protein [Streptococcaceae bacterium]
MTNDFLLVLLGVTTLIFIGLALLSYRHSWKLKDFRTLKLGRNILRAIILAYIGLNFLALTLASFFPDNAWILWGLLIEAGILFIAPFLIGLFIILSIIILTIKMWRRESKSLANFLLPLTFVVFLILTIVSIQISNLNPAHFNWLQILALVYPVLTIYLTWEFLVFYVSSRAYAKRVKNFEAKYYVVHGAGLVNGSEVGRLLASRIESAVNNAKKDTILVLSGGKGDDEHLSEASAMQKYAVEKLNFPIERTMLEDKSTTTYENLVNSAQMIKDKFLIFTSDYHVFRTVLFAATLKLDAQGGQGGKTAFYYRVPAFMREFIAVMSYQRKKHIIVVISIVAFFALLAGLSFVLKP